MPNWCENTMEVYGDNEDLKSFVDSMVGQDSDFDFGKVIPYPEGMDYNLEGYDWSKENWGTKWNAQNPTVDLCDGVVFIEFETAWSPSKPITLALSKKFPTLSFKHHYQEGGNDFSGNYNCWEGVPITEEQGTMEDYFIGCREDYFEPQD